MKKHLFDKTNYKNIRVPNEDMINIGKCGRTVDEWAITTEINEVTCKSCLKVLNKKQNANDKLKIWMNKL